jgi:hypothetical protein
MLKIICLVQVMFKMMLDGEVYVTSDVKEENCFVCVKQTSDSWRVRWSTSACVFNMCLLVAILASNVCFITYAAELIL